MNTKTYGIAYRAALANIPREGKYADERYAKDAAHAIASGAAMVAEGSLKHSDLKKPNEPAMVAALAAVNA